MTKNQITNIFKTDDDFAFSPTCMSSECCDQGAVSLLQFEDGYLAWMVTNKHMPGFNIESII